MADRYINPYTGSDGGTGGVSQPWATLDAARLALASPGNGITRLLIDTGKAPLYHASDTSFSIGANAAGITIQSATDRYADIRAYKVLAKTFTQPDAASQRRTRRVDRYRRPPRRQLRHRRCARSDDYHKLRAAGRG